MSSIVYDNLEALGATIGEKIGVVRLCRAEDGGRRGPARCPRRGESRPAGRRARRHRPGSCESGAQPIGTPGGGRQGPAQLHRGDATAHLDLDATAFGTSKRQLGLAKLDGNEARTGSYRRSIGIQVAHVQAGGVVPLAESRASRLGMFGHGRIESDDLYAKFRQALRHSRKKSPVERGFCLPANRFRRAGAAVP